MELASEARPDFLAEACSGEDELRREGESLLQARDQADGFIAGEVAGVVAERCRAQCFAASRYPLSSDRSDIAPAPFRPPRKAVPDRQAQSI